MPDLRKRSSKKEIVSEKNSESKLEEEKQSHNSTKGFIPLRILSRLIVTISMIIVVYYTTKDENFVQFAKQSEVLTGKGEILECSTEYIKEIDKYEGCVPKRCKRFVTDKVIAERESQELLQIAKKGFEFGRSLGGASILDLHSGALSQGQYFIDIYKKKDMTNLITENDFNIFRVVKDKIKYAIAHHFGVMPSKIYLTQPTFFSEITDKEAVTIHDEYWHPHVDKETYKSFHYTTLLYLSNYNIDFEGERFIFIDEKRNKTIEPRKARLSIFTSGAENLHYIEKVKSGTRYAMTISFTCDEKHAIPDPSIEKYNK